MKQYTNESQTAKLIELGFEKSKMMCGASITVVLRLHDGTTYSPDNACPVCGGEMVVEKIQMQERYMMRFCHRCGTTIKTPFTNIEIHTPF